MFFRDILNNLHNQIQYFTDVNKLCEQEKQAIIDGDVDMVSTIVEEVRKLYSKAIMEENQRIELIKNSKEFTGEDNVSIDDIINICHDEEIKNELAVAKENIIEVVGIQKELNSVINLLLESNLEYCNYMITAFSCEVTPNNLYGSNGFEVGNDRAAISIIDSEV